MASAADIHDTVFKNGTSINMARVVGADGSNVTQSDITDGVYSIYLLNDQDADSRTAVTGHVAVAIASADVIFDTLQTDALWTKDSTGYNFRHEPIISVNEAFAVAGRNYLVEYTLAPAAAGSQVILVRFRARAI
jgi:hypothetical protein